MTAMEHLIVSQARSYSIIAKQPPDDNVTTILDSGQSAGLELRRLFKQFTDNLPRLLQGFVA
jgi:hypothetical protein